MMLLLGTPVSGRNLAERVHPGKFTFGETLAVVLVQQLGLFGGRSFDERVVWI